MLPPEFDVVEELPDDPLLEEPLPPEDPEPAGDDGAGVEAELEGEEEPEPHPARISAALTVSERSKARMENIFG